MDILITVLVILHFIGLALLLGAFLVQVKDVAKGQGRVLRQMVDGVLTQLITGILLVGIYSMGDEDVNHAKITVKLLVTLIVAVLVFVYRKKVPAPSWAMWSIGGLTTLNVVLAVAW